jgi:hypothetical protein
MACIAAQVVPIRCYTYEGRPVAAVTLQGAAASLHTSSRQAAPSERYLRLLREGGPQQQGFSMPAVFLAAAGTSDDEQPLGNGRM